jgi:MFS family permease
MPQAADPAPSLWMPLRQKTFREFWLASLVSNFGTIMQSVGAAWLMTSLSASPVMVALVQTATNLPTFLLALPAGALADIVDRRRLILFTQSWMLVSAILLGLLALTQNATPVTLLALTFSLGLGAALNAPVLQAIVPELVPRDQLSEAITLNSAGFNLARAAGPALGGLVIAFAGVGVTFMINAASFVGVLATVFRWRRKPETSPLPAEGMGEAMRNGLRYARHSPSVRIVLVRAAAFIGFASALWALLPLIARHTLNTGPTGFGVLLGFFGVGAVLAALGIPRLRLMASLDRLLTLGIATYALALMLLGVSRMLPLSGLALLMAGGAWMFILSSFNTSIQWAVPPWIRGRTMALYLLVVFGGLSLGSPLWGAVASRLGLTTALVAAGGGMLVSLALVARFRLGAIERMDLTPSTHWPEPILVNEPAPEAGPVVVSITYRIAAESVADFRAAMREVKRLRLRNGAVRWTLLHDQGDPMRFVETFVDESWLSHMRQHQRPTMADLETERRAWIHHEGDTPPRIRHYLAERP